MGEMVDRVAKAILLEAYPLKYDNAPKQFDALTEMGKVWYRAQARAAVEAMREPTGEMKEAGAGTYGVSVPAIGSLPLSVIDGQPTKAWQAMIDEALK